MDASVVRDRYESLFTTSGSERHKLDIKSLDINQQKKTKYYATGNMLPMYTSSPWAVTVSWQHSYISKTTYKPSKLGHTDLFDS